MYISVKLWLKFKVFYSVLCLTGIIKQCGCLCSVAELASPPQCEKAGAWVGGMELALREERSNSFELQTGC